MGPDPRNGFHSSVAAVYDRRKILGAGPILIVIMIRQAKIATVTDRRYKGRTSLVLQECLNAQEPMEGRAPAGPKTPASQELRPR
jgi:hypothetical protein